MAKVYLDSGDNFVLSGPATVYGSTGTEKIIINSGVTGVTINANVERVDLAGASTAYTYKKSSLNLEVYSGTTLVASIGIQDDTNGTQLVFSNGSVEVKNGVGGMTLGGATVSSTAAGAVTPTTIDTATTSGSGSGGSGGGSTAGQTFSLTQGVDNLTGTSSDDAYKAFADSGAATLQAVDVVDGGAGVDSITALGLANGAFDLTNIKVEKFYMGGAAGATPTFDMNKVSGETAVYSYNAPAGATFSNIAAGTEMGVIGGAGTTTFDMIAGNTNTAATLVLTGATGTVSVDATTNSLRTLTVKGETLDSTLTGLTLGAGLTKLVFTGDKKVDASATNLAAAITEIDASQNTAGVKVQQDQTMSQKITMGSGADTVIINGSKVTSADTIKGGAGEDTLALTGAVLSAAPANISEFEVLQLNTTGLTQNVDFFPTTKLAVLSGVAAATFSNVANASTVSVGSMGTSLTLNLKADTASDTVTVNLGGTAGGATLASLNADIAYETVAVNSQGTAANTVSAFGTAMQNVKFTGGTALTLSNAAMVTGVIDASEMTAGLTVTAIGTTANQTLNGTAQADSITLVNAGANVAGVKINAGGGNDTISVAASADNAALIKGEAGNDTISIGNADATATITVNGGAGVDFINIDNTTAARVDRVQSDATTVADADIISTGLFVTGTDKYQYTGALSNGTTTTGVVTSAFAADATNTVTTDLSTQITANANNTIFGVLEDLIGDAATTLTTLADSANATAFATNAAAFETALVTSLGTIANLDTVLSASDKVLIYFENGTDSVLVRVTNTDTSVANTLTAAEIEVVGVFNGNVMAHGDFV